MGLRCIKQLAPAAATEEVLIDGSQPSSLLIKLITVCDVGGAGGRYTIRLALSGAPTTADNKQYVRYNFGLGINKTDEIERQIAVLPGDKIYVTSDVAGLAFNIFALEEMV
jgi:hypothetical protein